MGRTHWRRSASSIGGHIYLPSFPFPPLLILLFHPLFCSREAAPAFPLTAEVFGERLIFPSELCQSLAAKRILMNFSSKFPNLLRLIRASWAVEACYKSTWKEI